MTTRWVTRTRAMLRAEILEAAAEEVTASGWRGLRMQAVADRAGVSRQTVNNEFESKDGLARALVLHVADRYCDRYDEALVDCPDLETALRRGVHNAMRHAEGDDVFRAVLTPDGSDTFLPLYTSRAEPLLALFQRRFITALLERWPELDREKLRIFVDASNRLVLSHMLTPTQPPDEIADDLVALLVPPLRSTTS